MLLIARLTLTIPIKVVFTERPVRSWWPHEPATVVTFLAPAAGVWMATIGGGSDPPVQWLELCGGELLLRVLGDPTAAELGYQLAVSQQHTLGQRLGQVATQLARQGWGVEALRRDAQHLRHATQPQVLYQCPAGVIPPEDRGRFTQPWWEHRYVLRRTGEE